MKYRKLTSKHLRAYNQVYGLNAKDEKVYLKDIDNFKSFINSSFNKPTQEIKQNYKEHDFVLGLMLSVLGSLAIVAQKNFNEKSKRNIVNDKFYATDLSLFCFLNNICNTATAAYNLIKQGYDTQARVLVRTLDERIYQCAVLFHSNEDYQKWHLAQDDAEAKQAHYEVFAKRGRLLKKYIELEEKYFQFSKENMSLNWRKEKESYYSTAVHGASPAVLVGSFSSSFEDDSCSSNLFGKASSASEGTIQHIILQLHSIIYLLPKILEDIHEWIPDTDDEIERYYKVTSNTAVDIGIHWILNQPTYE